MSRRFALCRFWKNCISNVLSIYPILRAPHMWCFFKTCQYFQKQNESDFFYEHTELALKARHLNVTLGAWKYLLDKINYQKCSSLLNYK